VGEDSQGNIVPGLSYRVKQMTKRSIYVARKGYFHDGTPFDAEVVVPMSKK
jgi:hypothetical protein